MSSAAAPGEGTKVIFRSPAAAARIERGVDFLLSAGRATEVLIVGASDDAAAHIARTAAVRAGAVFGWHRYTLARLAGALAARALGERDLTPVGPLPLQATCARIVHRLGDAGLGRFASIADRPGLPRALGRTLDELRMAGLSPDEVPDQDVARLLAAYESELAAANLVDRAEVLRLATLAVTAGDRPDLVGSPLLLLDVPLRNDRERELCQALAGRARHLLMTVPTGDDRTTRLAIFEGVPIVDDTKNERTALARLQKGLFSPTAEPGSTEKDVVILSAPGESRECVEIARLLQREAEQGVPFDRMAVLLRSPLSYRAHLEEALRRASIPAHFARGTIRPDPAGRAFLALLACASDGLSARRFAEYLSLGEVADATAEGKPPLPAAESERWFPPDEETIPDAMVRAALDEQPNEESDTDESQEEPTSPSDPQATVSGTLRAPRLWERLLVDAAVIGGRLRWEKRLAGRREELLLDQKEKEGRDPDDPMVVRLELDVKALDRLRDYALPLLSELESFAPPFKATWGAWLEKMSSLATRALRHPERVLSVLAELSPMADIGPVDLTEIRLVLERRLTELMVRPSERPYGRVYVASVEEARGLAFDVVFVPGLAERLFPQKVTEDPILPDRERAKLGQRVVSNADRSAVERLMLRIAVGAARKRLVLCYPRIDIEQSRPRTPSFYGLEVLRAAEGQLPGFDELARRAEAEVVGAARLGWPAPLRPAQAIDSAEHDLSLLRTILERPEKETVGMARFLLGANPHLARALRFRARRWFKTWNRADGLVDPDPLAKPALAAHGLAARSYSPTALQNYAACPYKFVLSALHKLSPREEPALLEELDPLQRGSLIHEVQFKLLGRLRDAELLPVTVKNLDRARALLGEVIDEVAETYKDKLSPAIERVWEDGIASIRADLREMLRRATDEMAWIPAHFELSFGLTERRDRDPNSVDPAVPLDCGIQLRGSIDLVERRQDGAIRATDYKTGKARATDGTIIGGGETLQPVLYALTLEKIFARERVDSGRLYYCTSNGEFKDVVIPLDDEARRAAADVAKTVGDALEGGFLPAAPVHRGCEWCDYRPVCGPYEELRTSVRVKKQDSPGAPPAAEEARMKTLADELARERIRHDLESTLVVEAAAGTGKTTELVRRVLSLLRTGRAQLSHIVAVTFTEKAAGEMKLRLRAEIEKVRGATVDAEERGRLDHALSALEEARISTIHGFCADLLRERAVEARVDPQFEVAADDERERLYGESFERWFQAVLSDPPEGVRRILRRRARDRDAQGPRIVLKRAGSDLIEQRDFDAPWRRDPFDREGSIDAVVERLRTLAAFVAKADAKDDYLVQNLVHVRRFISELDAKEAVRGSRDHDGLEAELRDLIKGKPGKSWNWKGNSRGFRNAAVRKEALAQRDALREDLIRLQDALDADLAACLYVELRPLVQAYEELKTRAGKLDFLDLLLLTRNLLGEDRGVRNELQQNFSHLLVDEFQDTDPLQADILMLLSADDPAEKNPNVARPVRGKLFVVGDPKQSIYRFRRADVALYEATKRRLVAAGAEVIHLTTSFRSVPSIQEAVNSAFAPLMQGSEDGSQAEYVPLMSFRDEPLGRPTVVALPVPRPYSDWGKIVKFRIEESFPDAVGAFVDFLVNKSGFTITEREKPDQAVPVQARHVCLLFKRFQQFGEDVTRPYVRALEVRHVPHVLVGGRSFHQREEVLAIRNALSAIEWPDDELSVYATLRGPFFAVGDDALLAFRHQHKRLMPLRRLEESALNPLTRDVAEALSILGKLHRGRNRRPIADTLAQLLEATRAHAGVAIWPTGEQALGNILRVLDLARRFEASGATSFRSFVTRLEEEAERGGAAEAPVVEEGTDGVRIMTVHKAKGLEFPVVILVDPTAPQTARQPSRYVDPARRLWAMPLAGCSPIELVEKREEVMKHDREESVRLAYVATTRARELLVVPVVGDALAGDEAAAGWLDVLHPAIFPKAADRRGGEPAPGCPPFGQDSVRERTESAHRGPEGAVRPGSHRPSAGKHRVVWWDPSVLELDKQDDVGLRQQRILAADEGAAVATEGERLHGEWQERRALLLARGTTPSHRVATVSELTKQDGALGAARPAPTFPVAVSETDAPRKQRPHGKRFGVLTHAVLSTVDFASDGAAIGKIAKVEGRLLGATADEIAAAALAVQRALAHPLFVRARAAGTCRREAPILLELPDGQLVEGVLDLAFREVETEGPVWTVVDYKTDVEMGERKEGYVRQVALYAEAVASATGERACGVLLSV